MSFAHLLASPPLICLLLLAADVPAAPRTSAPEIPPPLTARLVTPYTFQFTRLPPGWAPSPAAAAGPAGCVFASPAPPAAPPLGGGSCAEDPAVQDGAY